MKSKKAPGYYLHPRQEMVELIAGNPKRVLEVGCGAGLFRTNFKDQVEYWGVEPCSFAAAQARQLLTQVYEGTYEEVSDKLPDQYFDLVVCNDVIEHMSDPKGFLWNLRRKIADGGAMIVSIPNLRNAVILYDLLFKGDFQYVDEGVLDYTHFHLFTKKSFLQMAESCGWTMTFWCPIRPYRFSPFMNIVLACIKLFIPEIKCMQIAARLHPKTTLDASPSSNPTI